MNFLFIVKIGFVDKGEELVSGFGDELVVGEIWKLCFGKSIFSG